MLISQTNFVRHCYKKNPECVTTLFLRHCPALPRCLEQTGLTTRVKSSTGRTEWLEEKSHFVKWCLSGQLRPVAFSQTHTRTHAYTHMKLLYIYMCVCVYACVYIYCIYIYTCNVCIYIYSIYFYISCRSHIWRHIKDTKDTSCDQGRKRKWLMKSSWQQFSMAAADDSSRWNLEFSRATSIWRRWRWQADVTHTLNTSQWLCLSHSHLNCLYFSLTDTCLNQCLPRQVRGWMYRGAGSASLKSTKINTIIEIFSSWLHRGPRHGWLLWVRSLVARGSKSSCIIWFLLLIWNR